MSTKLQISLLHRALKIPPGQAKESFCRQSECRGVDYLEAALLTAVLLAIISSVVAFPVTLLLGGGALLFGLLIDAPFRSCERLARARLRRRECINCGSKLGTAEAKSDTCPNCT
jgi:hypothetical protein